jgi:hypothetical protein
VVGTQQGGKSEIRSCDRVFVDILEIDISAFRQIRVRECRDRGDIRLGLRVSNSQYLEAQNRGDC